MRIGFFSSDRKNCTSMMRAAWPASWINRYTDHSAWYYPMDCVADPSYMAEFVKLDVAVFHKAESQFPDLAEKLRARGVIIVFDNDDYDLDLFDMFYVSGELGDIGRRIAQMLEVCHGYTVGSLSLLRAFSGNKPGMYVDNAFDESNYMNAVYSVDYYDGHHLKVAYGGGISHYRDMEMWLRLGDIQKLLTERAVDIWCYGMGGEQRKRVYGVGSLYVQHGYGIHEYLERCYMDASLLVAPLIDNHFNEHRSCLKLIEAGFAGLPVVASDVQCYRDYIGRDLVTLIPNEPGAWYDAISYWLDNPEERTRVGAEHRALVEKHYTARVMTDQRIEFFNQLKEMK